MRQKVGRRKTKIRQGDTKQQMATYKTGDRAVAIERNGTEPTRGKCAIQQIARGQDRKRD